MNQLPSFSYLVVWVLASIAIFSPNATILIAFFLVVLFQLKRSLLLFFVVALGYQNYCKQKFEALQATIFPTGSLTVEVKLVDLKIIDSKFLYKNSANYLCKVITPGSALPALMMLNFYSYPELHHGDVLTVKGRLVNQSLQIEGDFDYYNHLAKQDIGGSFYVKTILKHDTSGSWFSKVESLRHWLLSKLQKGYQRGGSQWRLITAVVLGEKRNLLPQDRQSFVNSGLFHIFAVSGMHVAIVAILLYYFLLLVRIPERIRYFILPALLLVYVLLTGAAPSSLRAWGMISIWQLGLFFYKATSPYNALAVCALLQLLWNPLLIIDAGFQFSFIIVFFLIRYLKLRKQIKSFFFFKASTFHPGENHFLMRCRQAIFELLYVGSVLFFSALGLQIFYFRVIQPLTVFTAVWSGFCASGIIFVSTLKYIFAFDSMNQVIDVFLIPLQRAALLVNNEEWFITCTSISVAWIVAYYMLLILMSYNRAYALPFFLVLVAVLSVSMNPEEQWQLYCGKVKGGQIVACLDKRNSEAMVWVSGRSCQSGVKRLLSFKNIKRIKCLYVSHKRTPVWQILDQFETVEKVVVREGCRSKKLGPFHIMVNPSGTSVSLRGKNLELNWSEMEELRCVKVKL